MAPRRALSCSGRMLEGPEVRALDPQGRFVCCRTCEAYHSVRSGRLARPVRMSARFRTRAWTMHKRRNVAHVSDRARVIDEAINPELKSHSEVLSATALTRSRHPEIVIVIRAPVDPTQETSVGDESSEQSEERTSMCGLEHAIPVLTHTIARQQTPFSYLRGLEHLVTQVHAMQRSSTSRSSFCSDCKSS